MLAILFGAVLALGVPPGAHALIPDPDYWKSSTSSPEARGIWSQTRAVVSKVRPAPALRTLGTVGLAVGAFDVGSKIGSGINAKWLHFGIPEAEDATQSYDWGQIAWADALSQSYSGAYWPAQEGWLLELHQNCCSFTTTNRWFGSPCQSSASRHRLRSRPRDPSHPVLRAM